MIDKITVVGLPYYDYRLIKGTETRWTYQAVWDTENRHSEKALKVLATDGKQVLKIGYISGRETEAIFNEFWIEEGDIPAFDYRVWGMVSDSAGGIMPNLFLTLQEVRTSSLIFNIGHKPQLISKPKYDYSKPPQPQPQQNSTKKETTMMDKIVNTNVQMAKSAAFLEAGRIANNAAAKAVASKAPLMLKGYVETAFGKLVIANAAAIAVEKIRPGDARLAKMANAMITEAYQEVYQTMDIEKMVNSLIENETVKAALTKLDGIAENA